MKNYFLIALSLCLFSMSCENKHKETIPSDVLQPEKMVRVLVKVNLLEASINLNASHNGKINEKSPYFNPLKEENVTADQYNKSFNFYSHHPVMMDSIYADVLNELSKEKAEELKR